MKPKKRLRLAVVVFAYNEEATIAGCLDAIAAQTRSADVVLLVDNNCTDRTVEIARQYPFVTIVHESRQGMIFARNRGFDEAAKLADIICRTDADGRPFPGWLAYIEQAFIQDDSLAGLTGHLEIYGSRMRHFYRAAYQGVYWSTRLLLKGHEYMRGPNMAVRASVWPQLRNVVSGNDQLVHEDMDISVQVARFGRVRFKPEVAVAAHVRTIRKSPRVSIEYTRRWFRTRRYLRRDAKVL